MASASSRMAKERFRKSAGRKTVGHNDGLVIDPVFCPADVADPFDTVEWDLRTAAIKGEAGELLFEQSNCEVPSTWTQLATNVVVSKYFYGEVDTPER
jgi:ribonucleoside-diphosphate reductase alpha chain